MNIGIIGAGNVGGALAKRLGGAGHAVMLSFSKDRGALQATAHRYSARAGTPSEAVRFGEVVVLAVPWAVVEVALRQAGPLAGKVLWDCTNALTPDYTGLEVGTTTSGGEIVQQRAPGARVVKGIPPAAHLPSVASPRRASSAATMPRRKRWSCRYWARSRRRQWISDHSRMRASPNRPWW
jgi:predicted dinucleotide-binding enzyme